MNKNNDHCSNGKIRSMAIMILLAFVCLVIAPAIAEEIIVESDGDTVLITFPDGTIIKTGSDGTVTSIISVTFPDGTWSMTNKSHDGGIMSVISKSESSCDRTITAMASDGTVYVTPPSGTTSVIAPDGTVTEPDDIDTAQVPNQVTPDNCD